ncbi:MAG: aldo/keto reductase [Nanoarchaeota archaeon]|nr:aldo/keto reductase [Nanoarchaeota archaeon]MBU1854737.1 aldo/keto reductase [Nanoarchaeota archaeon]
MNIHSKVKLNNGVEMPILGFGTWLVNEIKPIQWTLEEGYELIDTAIAYDNEELIGKAIKNSGVPENKIFITTKIPDYHYDNPRNAFEESLKKLRKIDLLLAHSSKSNKRVEAYKVLEELYKGKKCRAIGVSNFTIEHLKELLKNTNIVPAVNQVEFHVYFYQKKLLEFCKEKGIILQAYMPMARGKANFKDERLKKIAKKHSKTVPQIMIRWIIQKGIPTIPKSSTKERIIENKNIFDFELDEEDINILDNIPEQRAFCSANPYCKRFRTNESKFFK